MRQIEIPGLLCLDAPNYLAVMGLVRALRPMDVTVAFEGFTPVLHVPEGVTDEVLAEEVAEVICEVNQARGDAQWPVPTVSTDRSVLNSWFQSQWGGDDSVFGLDGGKAGLKEGKCSAGTRMSTAVNHPMSAAMLGNNLRVIRPGKPAKVAEFEGALIPYLSSQVMNLLQGGTPALVHRNKAMMGYSITTARAADRHSGSVMVFEIMELLASIAVPYVAPRGRMPGEYGDRWFWWWLNPAPMGWESLLALGRRDRIPGMQGLRCQMRSLGGSMKNYYEFTMPEEIFSVREKRV